MDHSFANRWAPEREKPLAEAVSAYLAVKTQEHERALLSALQLRSITDELAVLERHHPEGLVSQLGTDELTADLDVIWALPYSAAVRVDHPKRFTC